MIPTLRSIARFVTNVHKYSGINKGPGLDFHKIDKGTFKNEYGLAVLPEQESYICSDLDKYVDSCRDDALLDCYLILKAGLPVGFFGLDAKLKRHSGYVGSERRALVLRCFFVDRRHQGKGYALKALTGLDDLIRLRYPGITEIFLTVNFKNTKAFGLYARAGFTSLPEPYLGGSSGPQHVMLREYKFTTSPENWR